MREQTGRAVLELDTPALVVDLDVLERNLRHMQEGADRAGLQMRPHIKAHKTPEIARMQLQAGAVGVSAAKVSEAEVFADAGVEDIFIANEVVGAAKVERLVALARRVPRLSVAVDSVEAARPLSDAFAAAGITLEVLLEMDNGAGRCGVTEEAVLPLAEQIAGMPGLRLSGIMAYCPQGYAARGEAELTKVSAWEGAWLAAQADRLRAAGFDIHRVSGGSTPTAPWYESGCGLTEIRPGTYCLNDYNQVDLGACTEADVGAAVLATVISRPTVDRAMLDAGVKALGLQASPISDGYGFVPGQPVRLYRANDEHGFLDVSRLAEKPRVGDKVLILPPRLCTCVIMHDRLFAARAGRVEHVWRVAARGMIA